MPEKVMKDLELNRRIRMLLVQHRIDLGRIYMCTHDGCPKMKGSLVQLPGVEEQNTDDLFASLLGKLRSLTDSGDIELELAER
ncbi:MAG: hypothetical protein K9N51_10410 [Candidatus Pacebacteria bacterium]|nr:hypothetical protein [Candidatus Paceibacterota bacterium]